MDTVVNQTWHLSLFQFSLIAKFVHYNFSNFTVYRACINFNMYNYNTYKIVSAILRKAPSKYDNARFTTVPLKPLYSQ